VTEHRFDSVLFVSHSWEVAVLTDLRAGAPMLVFFKFKVLSTKKADHIWYFKLQNTPSA
jgi:hypothetical protein